jgi:hypothetical protein
MKSLAPVISAGLALLVAASAAAADFPVLWVPAANGVVPANAIIGGREPGRSLPVCRAIYNKGVHPGKVVGKNCNFGYGGKEVRAPQYDVLVGNPAVLTQSPQLVNWVAAQGGQVPPGAFFGAYEPGRPLLPICQAPHQGGVHVGKVVGRNCNFGYGGLEVLSPRYAVLVVGSVPQPVQVSPGQPETLDVSIRNLKSTLAALQALPKVGNGNSHPELEARQLALEAGARQHIAAMEFLLSTRGAGGPVASPGQSAPQPSGPKSQVTRQIPGGAASLMQDIGGMGQPIASGNQEVDAAPGKTQEVDATPGKTADMTPEALAAANEITQRMKEIIDLIKQKSSDMERAKIETNKAIARNI